jgi:glucose/mannose-6-phosphate isomerase
MPSILDSREKIKELDKSNLLGSVESLPDQIQDAWHQTENITFPDTYPKVKNIVVSGMGGSALGSLIIKRLFKDELTLPFGVYSHYHLPGYVNSDSLVLLSSYSGDTEETLAAAEQAIKVGAKIAVITGGGELAKLADRHQWPTYLIDATYNPSAQPRMAIGYAVFGQLSMFAKMGLVNISQEQVLNLVDKLRELVKKLGPEVEDNPAKMLTYTAFDKHLIFSAAEHLIGAAHVFNNQVNENAKTLTTEWHLPEFNHHYMEALSFPKLAKDTTLFLLFNSALYHDRVEKRFPLTKELLESKGYEVQLIQATAPTKLEQVFEIIVLGAFVSVYLAFLYGIPDPGPVPNVAWFKSQMAK